MHVGGLHRQIAGDHRCFSRRQRHNADRAGFGYADLFRQLRSRVGNQMRQRDLFAWYEFLNNAFFIHD